MCVWKRERERERESMAQRTCRTQNYIIYSTPQCKVRVCVCLGGKDWRLRKKSREVAHTNTHSPTHTHSHIRTHTRSHHSIFSVRWCFGILGMFDAGRMAALVSLGRATTLAGMSGLHATTHAHTHTHTHTHTSTQRNTGGCVMMAVWFGRVRVHTPVQNPSITVVSPWTEGYICVPSVAILWRWLNRDVGAWEIWSSGTTTPSQGQRVQWLPGQREHSGYASRQMVFANQLAVALPYALPNYRL